MSVKTSQINTCYFSQAHLNISAKQNPAPARKGLISVICTMWDLAIPTAFLPVRRGIMPFYDSEDPSQIPIGYYRISEVQVLLQCFSWQQEFIECCTLFWLCNINRNGSCHHILMGNNLWMQTLFSSPDDQIWQSFSETHGAMPV